MIELMETILAFPTQGHYGYPIRLDVFDDQKKWECGTWADREDAIGFVFDKCELFNYELNEWYIVKDVLHIVLVRKDC